VQASRNRVVLVVDDEVGVCRMLARLVCSLGHEGVCRAGGREALEYLRERPVDLVLLDLMMPEVDGTQVLRRLRTDPATKDVPVVIFTAVCDPAARERLMAMGASDYWVKASVDYNDLGRLMGRWLSA
jgi:CheY-like chemotaxis protein